MASTSGPGATGMGALGNRGAHPTTRLDTFLKHTDPGYRVAEQQSYGDRFVRKMATYGHVRPSVSFTSESRAARPNDCSQATIGASNLPPTWNDPKGDPKEGTFSFPPPPLEVNSDFLKMYENKSLMLPSERRAEHNAMKEGKKKWEEDRKNLFLYKKRMRILERQFPAGILGVDGPMYPDTKLWERERAYYANNSERLARHAEGRFENLADKFEADDATAQRDYGNHPQMERSQEMGMPRRRVDPSIHPFRFLDTHNRLFPQAVATWDPERAYALRSHEVRDKRYNIINGSDNGLSYNVLHAEGGNARAHSSPAQVRSNANWHQTTFEPG